MDASTITSSSFTLSNTSGAVSASVSYDPGTNTATLTPDAALDPSTTYQATVTTDVKDLAGNSMTSADSWSFTTATPSETVVLTPTQDSYVSGSFPTTNFGTASTLVVDATPDTKSYLKFDLSPYAGRTIQSASLSFSVGSSGSAGQQPVKIANKDTWTETGITYNNRPGLGTTVGTIVGPTSPSTPISVRLSPADLQTKIGLPLSLGVTTGSGDDLILASRETATPPTLTLVLTS
jgi:hypothetical protein